MKADKQIYYQHVPARAWTGCLGHDGDQAIFRWRLVEDHQVESGLTVRRGTDTGPKSGSNNYQTSQTQKNKLTREIN